MVKHSWLPTPVALVLGISAAACGSHGARVETTPAAPPQVAAAPAPAPRPDPIDALIARANTLFERGQRDLELGHIDQARLEFNRAVDLLLNTPGGARTEPRLRAQFDKLVDRISALEVAALASGDGFAEKPSEPASIDQLLALSSTFDKPTPKTATTEAAQTDLSRHAPDIPIPLNDRVLSYVELFQGRLRSYIQEGLERGSQYLPMIQHVFRAEGLPLDLAYVPLIESAFKPNAVSRARARGVWQFMHGTAVENGLQHDWYIDERSDPEKATHAAAKYLKTLYRMFDGDWHLALASYNGGPGRVQRAMKRARKDDFWTLSAGRRWLPRETREYVPMILAAILIARNPAQYGFTVDPDAPVAAEAVTISGPLDLRRVAEWTGTSVDVIEELNPELRRWTTPVRASDYQLKVPDGTAEDLRQHLAETPVAERGALNWHTVKRGETLATIARKLHVRRSDLAEANYLSVRSRVQSGQKLIIPQPPATLMAAHVDGPAPSETAEPTVERASLVTSATAHADNTRHTYRVKRGDTLSSIARAFETSVTSLKNWNRLTSSRINPGQRLTVYTQD